MTSKEALVILNALPKIGPIRVKRLLERFGEPEGILRARKGELMKVHGVGKEVAEMIEGWESMVDPREEMEECRQRGIEVFTREEEGYPKWLEQAYDPPLLLYVWGEVKALDRHAIGVVGSRRSTHYGMQSARKLSYQLAERGFTVVSGLARGIDTAAHEGALAAGGRTIAVIGSGMAKLYPPENMALAERIAAGGGAVVSEFSLHTAPSKQTFPMRNRIVAAWCKGLLVVECPTWSGSLITANLAMEYGKQVYAVPGPIDQASSAGCHQLIREGAILVADVEHLLEDMSELPLSMGKVTSEMAGVKAILDEREELVYAQLSSRELTMDQVIEYCGLPAPEVAATLTMLEMKRMVRALPGLRFVKRE